MFVVSCPCLFFAITIDTTIYVYIYIYVYMCSDGVSFRSSSRCHVSGCYMCVVCGGINSFRFLYLLTQWNCVSLIYSMCDDPLPLVCVVCLIVCVVVLICSCRFMYRCVVVHTRVCSCPITCELWII